VVVLNHIYGMILRLESKIDIWNWIKENYPLPKRFNKFVEIDATSQGTLPYVLHCFLSTTSTHACIEMAIGYGGDTDTNASIAAELSATFYNDITEEDVEYVNSHLDEFQLDTLTKFNIALNE
jgi:ADP-ribosylglycohydrolase